jgi:hypothetical protein
MQSDDANQGSPLDGRIPSSLNRLAVALGCTVEDFYGSLLFNVSQLSEVVDLWTSLTCDDDRERVLRLLRERAKGSQ